MTDKPKLLKNLAREPHINVTPHKMRQLLRAKFGKVKLKRWRWTTDKSYEAIKKQMIAFIAKKGKAK